MILPVYTGFYKLRTKKQKTYGRGPYPFACHARDPMLLQKKLNSDAFSIRILEERSCMTCLAQCT